MASINVLVGPGHRKKLGVRCKHRLTGAALPGVPVAHIGEASSLPVGISGRRRRGIFEYCYWNTAVGEALEDETSGN